ncbi:putative OsmC-like protein [Alkalispirillum mobile]|uniref:Putative OsmC-like protein n=1 Tax=Alkalispirillum mobile TaxID=85925 RepID=A0A498C9H4_9GAMM|nr:OsmC family protein [Alkalispirillum mobile]RLK50956.1 putative OsmC-like protein [Alkalispirillum mobile]
MSESATRTKERKPLRPIDLEGLKALGAKAKLDPAKVNTLKAHTECEGVFRMMTYCRDLDGHLIDEPPTLLGEDNAPNPSEATLAALASCLLVGIHANATYRGITLYKLEADLEGDINISSAWGVGDTSEKRLGFTEIRVKFDIDANCSREELQELIEWSDKWSPVGNTLRNPVETKISLA